MESSDVLEAGTITSGAHISYWTESNTHPFPTESLTRDLETDVVIVGGGLAGISIAYFLTQAGRKVALVEDGYIGSGETCRTTAHLSTALDDSYVKLEKNFGKRDTRIIAESHREAIDLIEHIIRKENIDCDFERLSGYLFLHPTDKNDSLQKELKVALRSGVNVQELMQVPGIPGEKNCLCFPRQAQLHPLKYLMGLCRVIDKNGGKLFTETHASEINPGGIRTSNGFTIKATHVVIATHAPVNDRYTMVLKQVPYRSYVIAALVEKNILPKAFWWDTGDQSVKGNTPYHYVRLQVYSDKYDLLLCGGEDHVVGNADLEVDRYSLLERWTREQFPIKDVVSKWSGEILMPMDSIAFIGRSPWYKDNVYMVTGDSGSGFTYGTIAGVLITDLITGRKNKWERIYRPSRFTFKTSGRFLKTLKDDFGSTLKKWFYSDGMDISLLEKGDAKILKLGRDICGVFRDENGKLHIVSASCTHLGCILVWNRYEKTWDCPCHGSRFTYEGKVINGPANRDLHVYNDKIIN